MPVRKLKVVIAGSRDFKVWSVNLDQVVPASGFKICEVVSGNAAGGDMVGEQWAMKNGIALRRFYADWKKHGNGAGPIRNGEMADYGDALIALWDGESRGTAHMLSEMRRRGKPVYVHRFDLKPEQPPF